MAALRAQLELLTTQIAAFDQAIEQLFAQHADAALFASLPGAGRRLAPGLLAEWGEDRTRSTSAASVQAHAGTAPVLFQSGTFRGVRRRGAPSGGRCHCLAPGAVPLRVGECVVRALGQSLLQAPAGARQDLRHGAASAGPPVGAHYLCDVAKAPALSARHLHRSAAGAWRRGRLGSPSPGMSLETTVRQSGPPGGRGELPPARDPPTARACAAVTGSAAEPGGTRAEESDLDGKPPCGRVTTSRRRASLCSEGPAGGQQAARGSGQRPDTPCA